MIYGKCLIVWTEPNVETFFHADEKSASYKIDGKLRVGFQNHSGNGGRARHNVENGKNQFQLDPEFPALFEYLLQDNLVVVHVGDNGDTCLTISLLVLGKISPLKSWDQGLSSLAGFRVVSDVNQLGNWSGIRIIRRTTPGEFSPETEFF